jgi:hypothetical protein
MKRWIGATVAAVAAVTLVAAGAAIARDKTAQSRSPECASPSASPPSISENASGAPTQPAKVEGEVVRVDPATNRVTVRSADGGVHEFTGSKEQIEQYKVGDRLVATRRAPNC